MSWRGSLELTLMLSILSVFLSVLCYALPCPAPPCRTPFLYNTPWIASHPPSSASTRSSPFKVCLRLLSNDCVNSLPFTPSPPTHTAIVEQVRDASTLRLMLLPERQMITLFISGIKAPTVKRDNVPDSVSEPFAEEAKYFTETRLLQCEVKVVLEDVASNNQNFIGSIIHPNGNIAEALLANGFATCLDASITGAVGGPQKLRDAER